ncbi:bifunctional transcriptional activator/DNA repair enzyme Ada [Sideroxyarcus emersonii]|uniref:methylated-DNA--[protein]-cysteine S-methyltransferase n=1 Tax=Sideroxyarcus emersonii TaxID=2764705 RepID=A0AAN1XBD7_9PROT|nr:methylated-DNA--[protein]-cysteine S-methyltransferase [Sideroxyarcus emersonii]BCK87993.1 bifunctional transcriptional activator/DNA repair enzyme Ada [Sideroxyarcus emersonii]
MPDISFKEQRNQYEVVARAIAYLRANALGQPPLKELADHVGLSEFHLQRIFTEWAGISPKRFLQYVTKEHARQALRDSSDVLTAALDSGLSGCGRLHDLMVSCEAMTPGEIRKLGAGLEIRFGFAPTPFGNAFIGWTSRGICHFEFSDDEFETAVSALQTHWPRAALLADPVGAIALAAKIFPAVPGPGELHLVLRGTNFQIKVWEALLQVAPGQVVSYGHLAGMVGCPKAARAVGSALAANTIGYLIPCHRVIRESGKIGDYRWGSVRKIALLAWEASRTDNGKQR